MILHIPKTNTKTVCGKEILEEVRSPVRPTEPNVCPECVAQRRPGIPPHATFYGVSAK